MTLLTNGAAHDAQSDGARAPAHYHILYALDKVRALLLAKNAAYGNSALDPVRVFSHADAAEQLLVRIDDKLSRIMRGAGREAVPEDTLLDLIGYLVLLLAQRSAPPPAGFADEVRAAQTREVK